MQQPTPQADVDRVLAEFARPAVAAPVTVTRAAGHRPRERGGDRGQPELIIGHADGSLNPVVDEARLRTAVTEELAQGRDHAGERDIPDDNGQPRSSPARADGASDRPR